MRKARILVVDDAVVVRRMLTRVLSSDPAFEVVGTAANGRIALSRIPQVNPDIVILDVEMPEMDGLETLAAIRKTHPKMPVIMYSTLTQRGAAATLDALAMGANDYLTKPSNIGGANQAIASIREVLTPKIKFFCAGFMGVQSVHLTTPSGLLFHKRPVQQVPRTNSRLDIVAIGVSTGGPNALAELLPMFPADFPVPVVIVQHMPPIFTKLLAERLSARAYLRVEEAVPGSLLQPGVAWVAPGNFHMVVENNGAGPRIGTHQGPPENSCRPAVDVLFRSAAEVYGPATLGVVMTGMGQDGLRGSEYIREAGGQVLAQDEATSVVWGMPGSVAQAGLADRILPLSQLGREIVQRAKQSRARDPWVTA